MRTRGRRSQAPWGSQLLGAWASWDHQEGRWGGAARAPRGRWSQGSLGLVEPQGRTRLSGAHQAWGIPKARLQIDRQAPRSA